MSGLIAVLFDHRSLQTRFSDHLPPRASQHMSVSTRQRGQRNTNRCSCSTFRLKSTQPRCPQCGAGPGTLGRPFVKTWFFVFFRMWFRWFGLDFSSPGSKNWILASYTAFSGQIRVATCRFQSIFDVQNDIVPKCAKFDKQIRIKKCPLGLCGPRPGNLGPSPSQKVQDGENNCSCLCNAFAFCQIFCFMA